MPLWCTCLFCIGWLRSVQRFIRRVKPLYDSLDPLFCDFFAAVVVCIRSLLLWSIKSHDVDLSVFCLLLYLRFNLNLEVIEKFQANKTVRLVIFHTGKVCTIRPWKSPEIHTGIFGRKESAHSLHLIPKWQPVYYSFVYMVISPLCLVIMYKIQKNFELKMRQRGLINMQTKE